jgi:hypothetical protein
MSLSPIEILQARLASGEITIAQYRELRAELQPSNPAELANPKQSAKPDLSTGRLLLKVDEICIYENAISTPEQIKPISDVTSVSGGESSFTFNFVPFSRNSSLSIAFTNGKAISLREDRAWLGMRRHNQIHEALILIRRLTFDARFLNLALKLRIERSIELAHAQFGDTEPIKLYLDGTIGTSKRRISIKEANLNGTFGTGSEKVSITGRTRSTSPNEVVISETKGFFGSLIPKDAIQFTPTFHDVDIVHALLNWYANPKNTLSRNEA